MPAGFADGYAMSDAVLAEARVFITPGGIFGSNGLGYVRASLCQPEVLLREALERVEEMKRPVMLTSCVRIAEASRVQQ